MIIISYIPLNNAGIIVGTCRVHLPIRLPALFLAYVTGCTYFSIQSILHSELPSIFEREYLENKS